MMLKLWGILLVLFISSPSWAYLTSDWDVSLGLTSLQYDFARLESAKSLESSTTLEVNYSLNNPSINTAMTLSFMEITEAAGLQMPFTRIAVGARYYVLGVNGMRTVLDSRTQAKVWRSTPFVAMNFGLSNLAVDKLNASLLDVSLRGGVEIPMMSNLLLVGQVSVGTSLTSSSDEDSVNYQFMNLFAGLRFVGFE
ncbi:hypothetical protein [Bdellovibrio sp. HCB288]|uniref:hypothetical protein n=1 Tax=Bdellovibrio sp. HCB288 TaxID=3394355 RepID=UPI0039B3B6EB